MLYYLFFGHRSNLREFGFAPTFSQAFFGPENQAPCATFAFMNTTAIFPKGDKAPAEYFTGTAWVKSLVSPDSGLNCVIGNVIFEPGTRHNWHKNPGGQRVI